MNDQFRRLACAFVALIVCAPLFGAKHYTLLDLGALHQGYSTVGRRINSSFKVIGSSGRTHGADTHAFVWSESAGMNDLGTLPGGDYSAAFAINNRDEVVGDSNSNVNARFYLDQARGNAGPGYSHR